MSINYLVDSSPLLLGDFFRFNKPLKISSDVLADLGLQILNAE